MDFSKVTGVVYTTTPTIQMADSHAYGIISVWAKPPFVAQKQQKPKKKEVTRPAPASADRGCYVYVDGRRTLVAPNKNAGDPINYEYKQWMRENPQVEMDELMQMMHDSR